jgi:SAM-dependent methyltransferase
MSSAAELVEPASLIEPYGPAAVRAAAEEVGLIDSLARPARPEDHAERLALDPEATRLVLEALVSIGVAAQREGRFGPAARSSAADSPPPRPSDGAPGSEGPGALWRHLPRFLRTGERFAQMDGSADERSAAYKDVAPALGELFEAHARELASKLAPAEAILDVGAGSGVWSLAMCERSATARVTALDLPDVLPAFIARAEELDLGDRVSTIPGDYQSVELPGGGFDRIVIANVLHLEPAQPARSLVAHVAPALRRGGELVVIDALAEGDPESARAVSLYALHLAMRTRTGRVHPRSEIESCCRDAGLASGELVNAEAPPRLFAALVCRAS